MSVQLTIGETGTAQSARKTLAEGISSTQDARGANLLCDRNRLPRCRLLSRLIDEAVRYLVDVRVELLQMTTVRARVGHVSEEAAGRVPLDPEIPLFD